MIWSSSVRARPAPPPDTRCSATSIGCHDSLVKREEWALLGPSSGTDLARISSRERIWNAVRGTWLAR